jgi:hypothetical protein
MPLNKGLEETVFNNIDETTKNDIIVKIDNLINSKNKI